jgi:integrase
MPPRPLAASTQHRNGRQATYTHARRSGAFKGDDPTKRLQFRNPEKPRKRYVQDDELDRLTAKASPKLETILMFAYLTGQRQSDIVKVRLVDIQEDGIHVDVGKTGARIVVEWSSALRACVDRANDLWKNPNRTYLFESRPRGKHAERGAGPYTTSGLRTLYRRIRERAGLTDINLHDLRRKAASDLSETDATRLLAHADPRVTRKHYRAKAERVKPAR